MPELPEVETIARKLKPGLLGKKIQDVQLRWQRTLAFPSPRKFRELVKGQEIKDVTRRAKYFILQLSDFSLLIHLRMSGDLLIKEGKIKPEKHDRLILSLLSADGELSHLVFNDTRKFGRVWLTPNPEDVLGQLGPEPLSRSFTPGWLYTALHSRHRLLKPLLLDQTFLAGIGNIYADESLWHARIHPMRIAATLTREQARALHRAIRKVLAAAIRAGGSSISDYRDADGRPGFFQMRHRAYDREGKPCHRCRVRIRRILVGGRSSHFCPRCQRAPRGS